MPHQEPPATPSPNLQDGDHQLDSNLQRGNSGFVFDLDAGIACLDFVNTLSLQSGDHLVAYGELVGFAEQSRLITPRAANRLRADGQRHAKGAGDVLARAKRLREALRGIFSALAEGRVPSDRDLAVLNRDLSIGMRYAQVERVAAESDSARFTWGWNADRMRLDQPLWPIARSAADLLTSDESRPLVRQCGAEDCRWLFLDTTKNRSRQWCSMTSCGNREKARRHYERVRSRRRSAEGETVAPGARRG
jgi:predicted RNA-binding Zn ribbon-like protein